MSLIDILNIEYFKVTSIIIFDKSVYPPCKALDKGAIIIRFEDILDGQVT